MKGQDSSLALSVIGAGHVGLVTAACLAHAGHHLVVVENDPGRLEMLRQHPTRMPIHEPGLAEMVERVMRAGPGSLRFTDRIPDAVADSEAAFICVGTPQGERGEANLYYVERVAAEAADALVENGRPDFVLIEKSTVPVRTGEAVRRTVERVLARRGRPDLRFEVVSNPEFLSEGTALKDFLFPDRIVAGVESPRGEVLLRRIYEPVLSGRFDWTGTRPSKHPVLLVTDVQSAELIKHASNSFLALKISYINAMANVCERSGADVREVARGMGLDPRIGPSFLRAGVGFGGYCFPKDVAAFRRLSEELGYRFDLLGQILEINDGQRRLAVEKLRKALWNLRGKTVAVWGLTFKPETEDLRGSPSLEIIGRLLDEGARVRAYDPAAGPLPNGLEERVARAASAAECAHGADAIVLVTEWPEFLGLTDEELKAVQARMNYPVFLDGRNAFDPARLRSLGFEYLGIGVR